MANAAVISAPPEAASLAGKKPKDMHSPQPDLTPKADPPPEDHEHRRRLYLLTPVHYPDPMLRKIVHYPDPILRKVCVPVERMQSHAGIGLAAPQVGIEQRLLVCGIDTQLIALANVQIQEGTQMGELVESCLSLPDIKVKVTRPERIRVTGYDVHGQRRSFAATGLWARVIQHELDHLNGVLICDYGRPAEACEKCPLVLPAALVEERQQQSHPSH
jgi:peptide deformylase